MEEKCITVAELKKILDKLIAEGKGDYTFAVENGTFGICEYDGYDDDSKTVYLE